MTTLVPHPHRPAGRPSDRSAAQIRRDLATRRPLVLLATLGGIAAAAATLLVCAATGLAGWYLTDGGAHGAPRDGLRIGALAWLMGHGSGVRVEGVAITAMPLGITVMCAWAVWRIGQRVGVSVSGHGPDAVGIDDGQHDLVVPWTALLFTTGYVVTAVAVATVVATPATDPSTPSVVLWALLLCGLVGLPAIAAGSGRAAIWTSRVPVMARATAHVVRRIVLWWVVVSLVAFLAALASDFSTAANVMGQLGDGGGGAVALVVVLGLVLLPNAGLFGSSYLLGPGFTVGTGTLVTPATVVLGPLPAFPMLAALPDDGPVPGWTAWLVLLAPLVAVVAVVWSQRVWPTVLYVDGAVRGVAGGVVAAILVGLASSLAGGSVGPGRMQDVAPYAFDTLLHAVTSFGVGGLLAGLAMTWWQRRTMPIDIELDDDLV